ncbi:unnamed protein product [Dicrocoelium dendriticum]|nr:unnamed protein product [Dicrocoelium dendriticum]
MAPCVTSLFVYFHDWLLYLILLSLRFLLVLRTQPGYVHPDEFFQSVEVASGDVYGLDVFRAWEFQRSTTHGPLRSIAGIGPLVHLPMRLYKLLLDGIGNTTQPDCHIGHSGSILIDRVIFPVRLCTVLSSFAVDVFILQASTYLRSPYTTDHPWFPHRPPVALLLYASATFGGLVLSGRTLVNTWEAAAVAVFGLLFMFIMRRLHLIHSYTAFTRLLPIIFAMCAQSVLVSWAIFLRPTYPIFILPMALAEVVYAAHKLRLLFIYPSSVCVLLASWTVYLCLLLDTAYFSYSSLTTQLTLTDFICVPCRFLTYNSATDHLAAHGLHPRYLHVLVNLPLILTPIVTLLALRKPRTFCFPVVLCWLCVIVPLTFLSLIPHQEPRFLIPLLPFACCIAGLDLERRNCETATMNGCPKFSFTGKWSVFFACTWVLQQLILLLFYGSLHQGGLLPMLRTVVPWSPTSSSICPVYVFYHTYMPPRFPLGRLADNCTKPNFSQCNVLVDLSGATIDTLNETLMHLRDMHPLPGQRRIVHVVYPGSQAPLGLNFSQYGPLNSTQSFFGHLSFDDFPLWRRDYTGITNAPVSWRSLLSLQSVSISIV